MKMLKISTVYLAGKAGVLPECSICLTSIVCLQARSHSGVPQKLLTLKVRSYYATIALCCCTAPYCTEFAMLLHCCVA